MPDGRVVTGKVVLTVDDDRRVLSPGWVGLAGDGTIAAVGGGPPPAGATVAAGGDVVMPGLISAHEHLVDVLVRGGPVGPTFLDWLLGTYHAGLAHARPEECAAAVGLVRAADLAAGVTSVVDCWSVGPVDDATRVAECAEASASAHLASGGRTVFAAMCCEVVPDGWSHPAIDVARLCRPIDDSLAATADLAARLGGPRLTVTPSPELPEMSTAGGMQAALALAERLDAVLPMHVCASPPSRAAWCPAALEAIGVLGPRLLAADCSAVDDADVRRLGAAGIGVAHCPSASRRLGGTTWTPLAALRAAGARGGLGLDNRSLHSGHDLFVEARQARLVAAGQAAVLDAPALLDLLTREAAAAAGLGDVTGALTVGRRADLVVLDAGGPHWWPRAASWVDAVVECAVAADVRCVLVDGRVVATDGRSLVTVDPAAVDAAGRRIRAAMNW
ncbi:MAG: amidohydrolase family protein [Ilumatobacteraceae bacterium]